MRDSVVVTNTLPGKAQMAKVSTIVRPYTRMSVLSTFLSAPFCLPGCFCVSSISKLSLDSRVITADRRRLLLGDPDDVVEAVAANRRDQAFEFVFPPQQSDFVYRKL